MGFSTARGSSVHTQCVLKLENLCYVTCVCGQTEEALEQTAQIISRPVFPPAYLNQGGPPGLTLG